MGSIRFEGVAKRFGAARRHPELDLAIADERVRRLRRTVGLRKSTCFGSSPASRRLGRRASSSPGPT